MVWEKMSFEDFRDGHRSSGYQNGMIVAVLNHCVTVTSHQVFAQSDLRFGRRCRLKNFKMAAMGVDNKQLYIYVSNFV